MMHVLIDSRETWCDTGIRLVAGRSYRLSARGTWRDASIVTDAAGYASRNLFQRATERLRRVPDAPWFALIGAVIAGRRRSSSSGRIACLPPCAMGS